MQGEGCPRAALGVGPQQGAQVEVGEDVAVKRQEAVLKAGPDRRRGEADRPGGTERLGLGDVANPHAAALALAKLLAQDARQEAAGEHHVAHPVGRQPLDHVGEKGSVDEGQRRLGHGQGQRPQAPAFPAD